MLGRLLLDIVKHGPRGAMATNSQPAPPEKEAVTARFDVSAIDDINCLVRARDGCFLANRHDLYLGRALIRYGECCRIEQEFLASLISHCDNIIEIGANIGVHTVGLAKAVGPSGNVLAIEAQPAVFRVLCANLALNTLMNVTPHSCGCGSVSSTMIVPAINYGAAVPHNSGGVSLTSGGNGLPVQVRPLDDLVENLPHLRLIKIDVEGMELEVLLEHVELFSNTGRCFMLKMTALKKAKP